MTAIFHCYLYTQSPIIDKETNDGLDVNSPATPRTPKTPRDGHSSLRHILDQRRALVLQLFNESGGWFPSSKQ